ncbi:AAA family ATPase [Dactylosporangium vinaceum]|uniref:AAA family ATPase n=1 Tax=Dactylosporangium vinaceum TaxID=53362 RepID=A0ABV5M846_9ACTN|nr:LuxR family transcriptional regulator [Dactylosporangium vinaceum]UAB94277.1 AAA family ATPase [Dactylosporangium vinaceum]
MTAETFIGRADELAGLDELLAGASDARPAAVMIRGDAGVGKSRLVGEFADRARRQGAQVLIGACVQLVGGEGEGTFPYAPLIDALRRYVRANGDPALHNLGELSELVADFTDSQPVGGGAGGLGSQRKLFGAVLRFIDRLSTSGPAVLVFEDLHWADQSTVDLISYLVRAKSDQRLVLVGTYRTQVSKGQPLRRVLAEPDFLRRVTTVTVPPFSEQEMRQLVQAARGPETRDLVHHVFNLSGGNAFFAEELIRATSTRIPGSLLELMLTRIEGLPPEASHLMRVAATAGPRVSERLLVAVCGLNEDELAAALRTCLDRDLLVTGDNDEAYAFRHALLRQAVYGEIPGFERRRLHTRMAEALTADPALGISAGSVPIELAHHWFEAGRHREALAATVAAGRAATAIPAYREAELQYRRTLELWSSVPDAAEVTGQSRDEVLEALAATSRWAGHVARAVESIEAALHEVAADATRTAELLERLGTYQWEAGDTTGSAASYLRAKDLLPSRPLSPLHVRVEADLATAALRAGDYAEARAHADAAVAMADDVGTAAERGFALQVSGLAMTLLGEPAGGIDRLREAVEVTEATGQFEDLLRTYANLAVALEHSGQLEAAADASRRGLHTARGHGLDGSRIAVALANNAGVALNLLGQWDEAGELLDDALLFGTPVGQSAYLRLTQAEIDVARGRFAAARERLEQIRERPIRDPRFVRARFTCEAELALWTGDVAAARRAAADGLEAMGAAPPAVEALRLHAVQLRAAADARAGDADRREVARAAERLARLARAVSDVGEPGEESAALRAQCEAEAHRAAGTDSAAEWAAAAGRWEALHRPYAAAYARWKEAEAAHVEGDAPRAAAALGQSLETAERLDARPLLDRLRALHSQLSGATTRPDVAALSEREIAVLRIVATGATYAQVGTELMMAESTVGVHVSNARRKLAISDRRELVAWARANL